MTDTTLDDLLRQAEALVTQALRQTDARCSVLGQYINDCESVGSRTAAWSDAARELRALHDYRTGLKGRHNLIQQALEYPAPQPPTTVSLPPSPKLGVRRTQQQIQIRARRRT